MAGERWGRLMVTLVLLVVVVVIVIVSELYASQTLFCVCSS